MISKVGKKYSSFELTENKKQNTLLISYGITSRIVDEIVKENGFSHFRPKTLFPINEKVLKRISKDYKNIIAIEMNEGQYAGKVQEKILKEVKRIRVIGAQPSKEDILKKIKDFTK